MLAFEEKLWYHITVYERGSPLLWRARRGENAA